MSLSRGTDLMDKVLIVSFPDQPHLGMSLGYMCTHVPIASFPDQPHTYLGMSLGHVHTCALIPRPATPGYESRTHVHTCGEPEESLKHRLKKISDFMCMLTLHVIV